MATIRTTLLALARFNLAWLSEGPGLGMMPPQPNILLIICDELRADALACMGNPVICRPQIGRHGSRRHQLHAMYGHPTFLHAQPRLPAQRLLALYTWGRAWSAATRPTMRAFCPMC